VTDAEKRLYESYKDAEDASALLKNAMLTKCLDSIRHEAMAEFADSAPEDAASRERAYVMVRSISLLENKIRAMAASGEFAQRSLRGRLI
jgi:hypothetical protein